MESCTFKGYKISATYLGNKAAEWASDRDQNYNNHRVTVSHNGQRASFEFWASIMHPEVRSNADLRGAFDCFLSDAMAGMQSFEEFCSDFGYDTDSRKAERTWRACQRSHEKAYRLCGSDDAIYKIAEALREREAA